jgi:hypothetical protein
VVQILDVGVAHLYQRALVAIARADDLILTEEGERMKSCIAARTDHSMRLDDLLLSDPLDPSQLADAVVLTTPTPFRHAPLHIGELASIIVADGLDVVLGKGYVSEAEGHKIIRFATALGCTETELRAMSDHLALWL